jgi:hypothetical protein
MSCPNEKFADDPWLGLLTGISMDEFCERWVPVILKIEPEDHFHYRRACTELLEKVTENKKKTVQNWLSGTQVVPDHVTKYLGVINSLWLVKYHLKDLFPEIRK